MLAKRNREIYNDPNASILFSFERCPLLQDSSSWARKSFFADMFGTDKRQKSYLQWINTHIHKPLTNLTEKKLIADSISNFRNIRCFMGDKKHPDPKGCAQTIIYGGIYTPMLRDEIYAQIVKQITNNPNPASVAKGWELMGYCFQAFAPIVTLNYIDYFVRTKSPFPEQMLILMYSKILFDPNESMQMTDIRKMLS